MKVGETFTGTAYIDPVFFSTDNGGCVCANVTFMPGARTHWHTHEKGQILTVTAGMGLICSEGQEPTRLRVGDIVHIPGGEKHWHGASSDTIMTHMAVALGGMEAQIARWPLLDRSNMATGCEWHEDVTQDEFEHANKVA